MSDRDYIHRAVEERVSRSDLRDRNNSADAFLAENPNCCTVYRFTGPMMNNWIFAPFFGYRVIVSVKYPREWDGKKELYRAEVMVQACGKPSFVRGIGFPMRRLQGH